MNTPYLERPITQFRSATDPTPMGDLPVKQALAAIKHGSYLYHVAAVRAATPGPDQDTLKKASIAYTFAGSFERRAAAGLEKHSGLVLLDYDHVPDPDATLAVLREEPHVLAAWRSITGTGLKVLVPIEPTPTDNAEHRAAYRAVAKHFDRLLQLKADPAACDVARLCFVSVDPDIYVNPDAVALDVTVKQPQPVAGEKPSTPLPSARPSKPDTGDAPWTSDDVRAMLTAIGGRPDYPHWVRFIAAVRDAVQDDAEALRLLQERWPEETPGEYEIKFKSPLEQVGRGTLLHLAERAGYVRPTLHSMSSGGNDTEDGSTATTENKDDPKARPSMAAQLLQLLDGAGTEYWHDANGTPFATVRTGTPEHVEHYPLDSPDFEKYLRRLAYVELSKVPNKQAVADAVGVAVAKAQYEGGQHASAVRVAKVGEEVVYLDLANQEWQVVEVRACTSRVIPSSACPVRFIRYAGMAPLPTPVKGGSALSLSDFINVGSHADLVLVLGCLVQALSGGPYPVLAFAGEAGGGKSSAARIIQWLIDPKEGDLGGLPPSERDLFAVATNTYVVAIDNASGLSAGLSDALCRLSTGGSYTMRKLYSNGAVHTMSAMRPVVLTSVADIVERQDLLDRTVAVTLRRIDDTDRRTEAELRQAFDAARPMLLGALLDAVASGLAQLPSVRLAHLPRMADFAVWATACEEGLGLSSGDFMRAYKHNQTAVIAASLEGNVVASAVRALADELADEKDYEGTASDLLDLLNERQGYGKDVRPPKGWPTQANTLSTQLITLAPGLRAVGVVVERGKESGGASHGKRTRTITIRREV